MSSEIRHHCHCAALHGVSFFKQFLFVLPYRILTLVKDHSSQEVIITRMDIVIISSKRSLLIAFKICLFVVIRIIPIHSHSTDTGITADQQCSQKTFNFSTSHIWFSIVPCGIYINEINLNWKTFWTNLVVNSARGVQILYCMYQIFYMQDHSFSIRKHYSTSFCIFQFVIKKLGYDWIFLFWTVIVMLGDYLLEHLADLQNLNQLCH